MDDDRIFGCLPGETPTSILLFQQERRHQEELTRLRAEADRMAEAIELYQTRERSWFGECTLTHGWQHGQCLLCTINRLRAELAEARAYKRAWESLAKEFYRLLAAVDEATKVVE